MKVVFYSKNNKDIPVLEFIRSLEVKERSKILACLKNIEEMGADSPRVLFRQIQGKLWEIKIQAQKSSYRIFYVCISLKIMVLLHAYKKQSQKAPTKELNLAEKRLLEVLENESHYTD
jgi:phage-related protein